MIKKLHPHAAFQLLCQATKKWGVFISFDWEDLPDYQSLEAAPYLNSDDDLQLLMDGCGIILCDTKKEMEGIYCQTVGDDGPTKTNPYNGPVRVYALTCNPAGALLSENT